MRVCLFFVGLASLCGCSPDSEQATRLQAGEDSSSVGEITVAAGKISVQPDSPKGFALVELFTSEGCSSCPPADQVLAGLAQTAGAKKLPIYTLSFHVDYWNHLGWKDPFSSDAVTKRQRNYANVFQSKRIYTPQMIVNGRKQFVGSNKKLSDTTVTEALDSEAVHPIEVIASLKDGKIHVQCDTQPGEKMLLNVALVRNQATRKVTAGENNRRTLAHVNIVHELKSERLNRKKIEIRFAPPSDFQAREFHVVAWAQHQVGGMIVGADRSEITP